MEIEKILKNFMFVDFPSRTYDKIRYADTDSQGHINNSIFSTFLETGRVEILYNQITPLVTQNSSFVIASLKLDYKKEITWPGIVNIGTGILKTGRSSITLFQKLYQNDDEVAQAETVIVQVNNNTKQSVPLTEEAKKILNSLLLNIKY